MLEADRLQLIRSVRRLAEGDAAAVDAFLARHRDTSMFLRSNLHASGFRDDGKPLEGAWFGSFEGEALSAVAMHAWNGNVIVLAAERASLGEVAIAVTDATRSRGRGVAGLIGPYEQVVAVRGALGLDARPATIEQREHLYALDVDALRVAPSSTRCRRTRDDDLDQCARWRVAYNEEALFMPRAQAEASARDAVERIHARRESFVLEDDRGTRVAYSAFNAKIADMVQIGGVWTPPELRGRGHGRQVVAGSLELARAEGVVRATLFTGEWNVAAQRAYEALGFARVGSYGLVMFAQ